MRFVTYVSPVAGSERVGVARDGSVHGLPEPDSLLELLSDDGERLARAGERALAEPLEVVDESSVTLRAPVPVPPSVRDFMAFEQHVEDGSKAFGLSMAPEWYEIPVFYFQNPQAVRGPREEIPYPPGSRELDFELEAAVVIGRAGSDLAPDEAERHIAGFLLFCDWSARDLQRHEMAVRLGPVKGKDTATSCGPHLVNPDELADRRSGNAYDLRMTASVNGEPYSDGSLASIYWSFGQMIAYASRGTRLVPGDVIASGTVGTGCIAELSSRHGLERYPWLREGDKVRLEADLLGAIEARIVRGAKPVPLR